MHTFRIMPLLILVHLNTIGYWSLDEATQLISFREWKAACDKLPFENVGYKKTALTADELNTFVKDYTELEWSDGAFASNRIWLTSKPASFDQVRNGFTPYAQKLVLPAGSEIAFHGDLHSDIKSLVTYIQYLNDIGYMDGFRIVNQKFYMIFLGDYVDRGYYGAEVFYTLLRLKCANPDHVFMVRGNHEDVNINWGKFAQELTAKFGSDGNDIWNCYNMLPVALFLGSPSKKPEITDYIVCCHGGLEIGFDPQKLLDNPSKRAYSLIVDENLRLNRMQGLEKLTEENRAAFLKAFDSEGERKRYFLSKEAISPYDVGFMWTDFTIKPDQPTLYRPSRGLIMNAGLVSNILKIYSSSKSIVHGIFRAHQHHGEFLEAMLNKNPSIYQGSDDDRGVAKLWWPKGPIPIEKLWDDIVSTFLVNPNARTSDAPGGVTFGVYGKYNYDAFGILKLAEGFENWRLSMTQIDSGLGKPLQKKEAEPTGTTPEEKATTSKEGWFSHFKRWLFSKKTASPTVKKRSILSEILKKSQSFKT